VSLLKILSFAAYRAWWESSPRSARVCPKLTTRT
jgi:hypothetical protein